MASQSNEDGSEDVADFLERIRELGDTHAKEDEERTRKLEEEILQGRKERQARRAERARSISPTKESPLSSSFAGPQQRESPTPRSQRNADMNRSSIDLSPTRAASSRDSHAAEPAKSPSPSSGPGLQRSGTLSWQQRPDARSSPTIRTRPAPEKRNSSPAQSPREAKYATSPDATDSSREQAAAMLRGKDPAWFRQTEDRGKQSAAYRKNQDGSATGSESVRLHGLGSPSSSATAVTPQKASGSRSPSPDRATAASAGQPNMAASPMPVLSSQRFRPPESPASHERPPSPLARSPTTSSAQGRVSPERLDRPNSPTKGLGGFVQSAMMKRSDSVSKRWSGQPGSPTRSSTISNGKKTASNTLHSASQEDTTPADSDTRSSAEADGPSKDSQTQAAKSLSPELSSTRRGETANQPTTEGNQSHEAKRWSPTKSSWLEAAINKSDPPKAKAAPPSQPSWMAEINKAKQARLGSEPAKDAGPSSTTAASTVGSLKDAGSRPVPGKKPDATTDFRGSLRARPPPAQDGQGGQPEFKNVFGKLKKTETKNYVAPDELKNNITRGKAALSVTGGPRAWVKKDEFKDSILAKKKEMKEGTSVVKTGNVADAPAAEVPEAVAKRGNMSTADRVGVKDAPRPTVPVPKPKPVPAPAARADTNPVGSEATGIRGKFPESPKPTSPPPKKASSEAASPKASSGAPTELASKSTATPRRSDVILSKPIVSSPSKPSSSTTPKKLVDRLNPALASIIARGPPGAQDAQEGESDTSGMATAGTVSRPSARREEKSTSKPEAAPTLTHTTKARARGPKRRLPTKTTTTEGDHTDAKTDKNPPASESIASNKPTSSEMLHMSQALPTAEAGNAPPGSPPKSAAISKKDETPVKFKPRKFDMEPVVALRPSEDIKKPLSAKTSTPKPTSPKKESPMPKFDAQKPSELTKIQSATGRLESPSTTPKEQAEFRPPEKVKTDPAAKPQQKTPLEPGTQPKSPPTPGRKPLGLARVKSEGSESSTSHAPKHTESKSQLPASDVSRYLSESFGQDLASVAGNEYSADTQAILEKKRVADKIKTQKKEIWEVTGDGKKISVPAYQEHILFDNSMFLCTHAYESANGKRTTDVHLWVGNEISPSAVEDAQLFCRNSAKEAGGRLTLINQGKEPPSLFEALGGIVITRKGSPSSAASSRYMLCGRRHLGHVAFDEVAFSPDSLFSGFTYIVASADGNKLFLWKGKGSGTDVVGCARLIAMDLGITGDVEEIEDGSEPSAFWKAFGGDSRTPAKRSSASADASWEKYSTRLFAIDADARPKSSSGFLGWARRTSTPAPEEEGGVVREIHPFAQSDLSTEGIYVVDAFFELYVIVGSSASSKLSSLHTAVFFAQEYGVLAASLEDRSFIPSSKVIFGGMTENVKYAFRRWDDRKSPTAAKEMVVDLNEVLGAFNEAK